MLAIYSRYGGRAGDLFNGSGQLEGLDFCYMLPTEKCFSADSKGLNGQSQKMHGPSSAESRADPAPASQPEEHKAGSCTLMEPLCLSLRAILLCHHMAKEATPYVIQRAVFVPAAWPCGGSPRLHSPTVYSVSGVPSGRFAPNSKLPEHTSSNKPFSALD
jgi:hypothetical protein